MYTKLLEEIRQEFPDFKIREKQGSTLMRVFSVLLYVATFGLASKFMTDFVTVLGCTVYVPSSWKLWSELDRTVTLRHERVHMRQRRRYGTFLFAFLYLLVPLPVGLAYFRYRFEREAYAETVRATAELCPSMVGYLRTKEYENSIVRPFVSPSYLWMWPFRRQVQRWYAQVLRDLVQ